MNDQLFEYIKLQFKVLPTREQLEEIERIVNKNSSLLEQKCSGPIEYGSIDRVWSKELLAWVTLDTYNEIERVREAEEKFTPSPSEQITNKLNTFKK